MKYDKKSLLLYAVTDRNWLNNDTLYEQVEKTIKGGVTFVQLREKNLDEENLINEALEIQKLCRKYNIPFVVNDNVEIARAINARNILGNDKIIGVSVQTEEQAIIAEKQGADYLGVGAVFPTGSKTDAEDVSYETLKKICETVSIPVVAIGGINASNVLTLKGSGIAGIAVISAIFGADDIEYATKNLKKLTAKVVAK